MGVLTYGHHEIRFDDRTLAHLQIVITGKLRRREPFVMSWIVPVAEDSGRSSIWVSDAIPLLFTYGTANVTINKAWLEQLVARANSNGGLTLIPEPQTSNASGNPQPVLA